jgi:hypothetical protein
MGVEEREAVLAQQTPVPSTLAALRAWSGDEVVREVRVHGEGFAYAQLFHHDEAQTIHSAVRLILVPLEVVEGCSFLIWSGPVDARQLVAVKLITQPRSLFVANLTS